MKLSENFEIILGLKKQWYLNFFDDSPGDIVDARLEIGLIERHFWNQTAEQLKDGYGYTTIAS